MDLEDAFSIIHSWGGLDLWKGGPFSLELVIGLGAWK